jgi:branched-chain amino acid aminotransferase
MSAIVPRLNFGYHSADSNVRFWFRDGKWSGPELAAEELVSLHIAAPCVQYGQAILEGLKAYERPDGEIQVFRPRENVRRMQRSARRLMMEPVPEEVFLQAISSVVQANRRLVPPYGSDGSLYLRPLELGITPQLGQKPSEEFLFLVYASAVGPYFARDFAPIRVVIEEESDRAAPSGIGDVKAAGNYAAGLAPLVRARNGGFADVLYLDAREKKYIEELTTSNFFAIRGSTFITPASPSILDSITNMSVCRLAGELDLRVERRPVSVDEIPTFAEAGALGTAAGIVPIGSISYKGGEVVIGKGDEAGPMSTKLYQRLRAIQTGTAEDPYGWCYLIPPTTNQGS